MTSRPALARTLYARLGRLCEREATFAQHDSLAPSRADLYLTAASHYHKADSFVGGTSDFGLREAESLREEVIQTTILLEFLKGKLVAGRVGHR